MNRFVYQSRHISLFSEAPFCAVYAMGDVMVKPIGKTMAPNSVVVNDDEEAPQTLNNNVSNVTLTLFKDTTIQPKCPGDTTITA